MNQTRAGSYIYIYPKTQPEHTPNNTPPTTTTENNVGRIVKSADVLSQFLKLSKPTHHPLTTPRTLDTLREGGGIISLSFLRPNFKTGHSADFERHPPRRGGSENRPAEGREGRPKAGRRRPKAAKTAGDEGGDAIRP